MSRISLRSWVFLATSALIATCVASGCGGSGGTPTPTSPSGTLSSTARSYLTEVLAVMQEHSVNRLKIDWNAFRGAVLASAGAAQTVEDTFPAIRTALTMLDDGRGSYEPLRGTSISTARACGASGDRVPTLPGTVGYVKLGAFNGSGGDARAFANALQAAIAGADRDDLAGWIVDLRGNGGGNMWPMLAGVGPVLGDGRVGYFIEPAGAVSPWEYRDGGAWLSGVMMQGVDAPYRVRRQSPNVAVLVDNATAGSGEALLIAFQRRPNTRSFGTFTCGRSTTGQAFPMSDGASLVLAVSVMADRTRVLYGDRVAPDEVVTDPSEVEQRAVSWIQAAGS